MKSNVRTASQKPSAATSKRATIPAGINESGDDRKLLTASKSRFRFWSKAAQAETSSSHDDGGFNSSSSNSVSSAHGNAPDSRTGRSSIDAKMHASNSISRQHHKTSNQNNSPAAGSSSPGSAAGEASATSPMRITRRATSVAGGKYSWHDDGDYFMSEPSLSEEGGDSMSENELHSYRDSIGAKMAESNGIFKTGAMHLSPPRSQEISNRRNTVLSPGTLSRGSFASSPGNTSLSSKDMSPSRMLQFESLASAQGEWFGASNRGDSGMKLNEKVAMRQANAPVPQLKMSATSRERLAAAQSLSMLQAPSLSEDEDDAQYPQVTSPTERVSNTSETDDVTPVRGYKQNEHYLTPETDDSNGSKVSTSMGERKDGKGWREIKNDINAYSKSLKDSNSPQGTMGLTQHQSQHSSNFVASTPIDTTMSPEMLHFMSPQEENYADEWSNANEAKGSCGNDKGKIQSIDKHNMKSPNNCDKNSSKYVNDNVETKNLFTIDDEISPNERKPGGGGDSSDATQQRAGAGVDLSSSSESSLNYSSHVDQGDHLEDSIPMTISQSVNEGDAGAIIRTSNSSKVDEDVAARKITVDGHRHEELSGADDEKTLERPRRKRTYSSGGAPCHRRARSGDGAAATLMTGRTEWIGMEIDQLPVPPAPSEHDDDDDEDDDGENDENDDDQDMVDDERYDEVPQMQKFPGGSSGSRGGMFDFLTKHRRGGSGSTGDTSAGSGESSSSGQVPYFAMGAKSSRSPTRAMRRLRQQQKQRQKLKQREKNQQELASPGKDSDMWVLSDSTADFDDEPYRALSGMRSPGHDRMHSGGVPIVVERGHRVADSLSTLGGFGPENDNNRDIQARVDEEDLNAPERPSSRVSLGEGSEGSSQGSKSSAFSWISSRMSVLSGKANSLPRIFSRRSNNVSQGASHYRTDSEQSAFSETDMGDDDSSGDQSVSSESDVEDYIADTNRATNHLPGISSELSPTGSKSTRYSAQKVSPRSEEHQSHPDSDKDNSSFARRQQERIKRQEKERIRKLESHIKSISSVTSDRTKSSYKPSILVPDDEIDKYPTYICPRCKTRQREFFSVATAPRQFDGPAGYLAFYFAIYVLASLFIFGLEEGWPALECVYFAVITLTTAGLGDYVPTTNGAKLICSVFIYFGVACIGLLLGSLLASSLDDASRKAARENQMANCPNCERILDNSKSRSFHRHGSCSNSGSSSYFSDRLPGGVNYVNGSEWPSPAPSNKRFKTESGHSLERPLSRITEGAERNNSPDKSSSRERTSSNGLEQGNSSDNDRKNRGSTEPSNEATAQQQENTGQFISLSPRLAIDQTMPEQNVSLGVIDAYKASFNSLSHMQSLAASPESQNQGISPPSAPESPALGDVLERQSHTRHMSFDTPSMGSLGGPLLRSFAPQYPASNTRTYSYENSHAPSFSENLTYADRAAAAGYGTYARMQAENADFDDSGSSSTDSMYFDELDEPREISRVEAAKYVILTLKQAVANSIFIIAIGSFGFYFIERMTPVDSFYFTTVLLTTVGYGDIVPKTSEGKMFATVYVLVAGTVLLHNMSMISMIPIELRKRRIEHAVLTQVRTTLFHSSKFLLVLICENLI
uniref:Potassium channel domain-containing protein n=1 Tax=Ditylum brightwellii TaxID=49249 RepID=A0A7S4VYN3_9STRA